MYDGYPHVQARDPGVRVHLYGKAVKPGRKVGHVTAYGDDLDDVLERARHAAHWFEGRLSDDDHCRTRRLDRDELTREWAS